MSDDRWNVGGYYEDKSSGRIHCRTIFDDAMFSIAVRAEDENDGFWDCDISNDEATELVEFMTELVHEIERLQGENIFLADALQKCGAGDVYIYQHNTTGTVEL